MTNIFGKLHDSCSFCNRKKSEGILVIAKPSLGICDKCVHKLLQDCDDADKYVELDLYSRCEFCSFMREMPDPFSLGLREQKKTRNVFVSNRWVCQNCLNVCMEIINYKSK
ncbi:MAG: hypothetical protein LCH63_04845 [Candidatus Melainabacteria bacterium]|nr:hypothetical protein [Candidatus Melainabacteria bacterium]